jgi:Bax protein
MSTVIGWLSDRVRSARFDFVAMSVVATTILFLYGAVLGEAVGWLPQSGWIRGYAVESGAPIWFSRQRVPLSEDNLRIGPTWRVHPVKSASALADYFQRVDYRLQPVRDGIQQVPRIVIEQMPEDLHSLKPALQRKRVFIKLLLPLVLFVNERIWADRGRLIELREDIRRFGVIPDPSDRRWLRRMCKQYGLDVVNVDALLRHIDVIPPSLAIAQAAEETGWGTSRFVREGNAVFGQRTFEDDTGLVPKRREEGETYQVRAFGRLLDSVAAYMFNLNSHHAYAAFRRARDHQRKTLGDLDGHTLAGTLERYSERRKAYVEAIREIIKTGGLRALDRARLGDGNLAARSAPKA